MKLHSITKVLEIKLVVRELHTIDDVTTYEIFNHDNTVDLDVIKLNHVTKTVVQNAINTLYNLYNLEFDNYNNYMNFLNLK